MLFAAIPDMFQPRPVFDWKANKKGKVTVYFIKQTSRTAPLADEKTSPRVVPIRPNENTPVDHQAAVTGLAGVNI